MSTAMPATALTLRTASAGAAVLQSEDDELPCFLSRPARPQNRKPAASSLHRTIFVVLLPFASGYCLAVLYRTLPAVLSGPLMADLNLKPQHLGLFTSVHFLAFAVLQLPIGAWLDRYGPRQVQALLMISAVLGASLYAIAENLFTLALACGLIGFGVSGALIAGLKAIVLYVPPERIALANGVFIMLGSLGAVIATLPAELLIAEMGWRGLYVFLAIATASSAFAVFFLVPKTPPQRKDEFLCLGRGIGFILRDARFWRLAPLSAASIGSAWALHGLWAGPWLNAVEGLSRTAIVSHLLAMALVLAPSALMFGAGADRLSRYGVRLPTLFALATLIGILAQLALIIRLPLPPLLPWLVIAGMGPATVLSYAILTSLFPPSLSGRASATLNLFHMSAAFLVQSGIGALIGLRSPESGPVPAGAYISAFGVLLVIHLAAWLWFVWPRANRALTHLDSHAVHKLAAALDLAPAAAIPYLAGRQIWRARLTAAQAQSRSWRLAAFVSITIMSGLGFSLIHISMSREIVPHYVEVAELGEAGTIWRFTRDPKSASHLKSLIDPDHERTVGGQSPTQ